MGMGWNWKEWIKAALVRALKTFAQTFVGCVAVGAALEEVEWLRALSVSGVSCVLSIMTSALVNKNWTRNQTFFNGKES